MKNRLKHWWNTPGIWTICFAVLFDRDVATIDFERDFDVFNLVEVFTHQSKLKVVYPEMFSIISAMLAIGLRTIVRDTAQPKNDLSAPNNGDQPTRGRRRTMSLSAQPLPPGMWIHSLICIQLSNMTRFQGAAG